MKKIMTLLCMVFFIGVFCSCTRNNDKTQSEEIKAFDELLSEPYFNWRGYDDDPDWEKSQCSHTSKYQFAYVDLNGDGVKELMLHCSSDIVPYTWGYYRVLVYTDGQVNVVDKFSSFEWKKNAGVYQKKYWHQGGGIYNYIELSSDGEVTEKVAYETLDPTFTRFEQFVYVEGSATYYTACRVDGEDVSYQEFKKEWNKLDSHKSTEIIFLDNTAENREKYAKGKVK